MMKDILQKLALLESKDSEQINEGYRIVATTKDGESFKTGELSKKQADDKHWNMTKVTDKRGNKVYKKIEVMNESVNDTIVLELYRGGKLVKTKRTTSEIEADDYAAMAEERGYKVKQYLESSTNESSDWEECPDSPDGKHNYVYGECDYCGKFADDHSYNDAPNEIAESKPFEVKFHKGTSGKVFVKKFTSQTAYEKWHDANEGNIEVLGFRDIEESAPIQENAPAWPSDQMEESARVAVANYEYADDGIDFLFSKAESSADAKWLSDNRSAIKIWMTGHGLTEGVAQATAVVENEEGPSADDFVSMISRRIMHSPVFGDVIDKHGLSELTRAIDIVAEDFAGFWEAGDGIGSSDVSAMVNDVFRELGYKKPEKVEDVLAESYKKYNSILGGVIK